MTQLLAAANGVVLVLAVLLVVALHHGHAPELLPPVFLVGGCELNWAAMSVRRT